MADWFVLSTHARGERRAAYELGRQAFTTYLPLRAAEGAEKLRLRDAPLFPGYIFAQPHESGRWVAMRSTLGVRTVLLLGDEPARLSGAVVEAIQAREALDGLIHLHPDPEPVACPYSPGDAIVIEHLGRIIEGVFRAQRGARAKIILSMLGRPVVAEADIAQLRARRPTP